MIGQFSASLIAYRRIRIVLNNDKYREEEPKIVLYANNEEIKFTISNKIFQFRTNIYELDLEEDFKFGLNYLVHIRHYGFAPLNVSMATGFPGFDKLFNYQGNDLGAYYTKTATTFKLWAPLASRVVIRYSRLKSEKWQFLMLERGEMGVFSITLKGNYEKFRYRYIVINNGVETETTDPYAFGSTPNGVDSVVINFNHFKVDFHDHLLSPITSPTEMIIYETSVRDMTSDDRVNFKYPGTFYGMIEEKRQSKNGAKAGFDYIKDLGITHLQLLPIYDFKTVDETDKWSSYNWGYDPQQYFVPEGSYARKIDDPYSRINDLMLLVSKYHQSGIRISMDVVFNHVYEASMSSFEAVVPNYYFRKDEQGKIVQGSGCGNDLATERPMVRKLIVDAALFFIKTYHIDAYRFDLVGLIDQKTIQIISEKAKLIRPDFLMYGEGWNMHTALPSKELTNMDNAFNIDYIGFFNDSFREIVKGGSFESTIMDKGYMLGNAVYRDGFKFALKGSVTNHTFTPKFQGAWQSINYVECHDNGTLIDKLSVAQPENDLATHLKKLQAINAVVMLAFGVPFFHRGQEIGISKYGDMNSYKSSDKVNQFAYTLVGKRPGLVNYFKDLVRLRKDCKFLHLSKPELIEKSINFIDLANGNLLIQYLDTKNNSPYRLFNVYINITNSPLFIELEQPQKVILNQTGYIEGKTNDYVQNMMVPKYALIIVGLRNEDKGSLVN
ncbi:MAG TPA: type I pullulanase [Bacilli bacterium]|nr:type I pullulanase [Bacilli bacterium]